MSILPEASLSNISQALPIRAAVAVLLVAVIALALHYMSPLRLTDVLLSTIAEVEEICIEAHGVLPAAETEILYSLQLKVSTIIEETLYHSLSWRGAVCDFLWGRAFTLLACIKEVQRFKTRIKILKEYELRTESKNPRAIILRRRGVGLRYGGTQPRTFA
ncbi:hypothetical protein K438DRAFT_1956902 [Mycena galopus ATCC 62051]|nr:hypothetical protein K438DRAFT_1956902 [Mycena galopus ATCC 62051]